MKIHLVSRICFKSLNLTFKVFCLYAEFQREYMTVKSTTYAKKKKRNVLSKKAVLNKERGQSFAFEFSSPKVKALKEAWLFT